MYHLRNTVKTFYLQKNIQNLTFGIATSYRRLKYFETMMCVYRYLLSSKNPEFFQQFLRNLG